MHTLWVFATEGESQTLRKRLPWEVSGDEWVLTIGTHTHRLIHTGIGMVNTAFALTRAICKHVPDQVINLGIAGAWDQGLRLGQMVEVRQDRMIEMGAESPAGFLDLADMGFVLFHQDGQPVYNQLINPSPAQTTLAHVSGGTVNKVHGEAASIAKARSMWPEVQVESMEGAAVFLVCQRMGVPFAQFRSISNYVTPRDRSTWEIPLAIEALAAFGAEWVQEKAQN